MFNSKKKKSVNILILGLGEVGYYLAERLVHEGYAVTAIEPDGKLVSKADGSMDARVIQGDAMDMDCWREADAGNMDYLIAVTNNDAVNMVSCLVGDRFGIGCKIARVRSTDFGGEKAVLSIDDLKIDMIIHPEELASQEISRLIRLRAGNEIIDVAGGRIQAMATRVQENSPLVHRTLRDIADEYSEFPFRAVAIARGTNTLIPSGEDKVLPQDQVFFMTREEYLANLMKITEVGQKQHYRVMIIGGGLVGRRLAQLLDANFEVRLIEKDEETAQELSYKLKNTQVFHGDGSDPDVLISAGLLEMDTFITATGENEANIMSCVLAKHLMASRKKEAKGKQSKCISLVNKEQYVVLASSMGSDLALNKKIIVRNEILRFIRRGQLISVAHLHGFDAEMVEIVAQPGAPITKQPLSKLGDFYSGKIMIGSVFRDGAWEVAVGTTRIKSNERVIVACKSQHLKDVQKLFLA